MATLAFKGGTPVRNKPFHPWPIVGDDERKLLLEVFDSGVWSFGGPKENDFAQKFAEFTGAKHAFCVSNGSVSLEIAMRALGIGPGDEVIVPALTWHATAWCVVQVGATVVFADVRETDWCIDPADVRKKITPRTKAIIPVHLYNQIAQLDELLEIAKQHKLHIVEDCAHTHGSQWEGRGVGTIGQIGSFSFQQSKGMTGGEGGMLVTNDEGLASRIYGFKNCGRPGKDGKFSFGSNNRITEFQAAVLLPQLARLGGQLNTKTVNASHLHSKLSKIPGIHTCPPKSKVTRQGMYGFAVRFDPDAFGGLPQDIMINAIKAEGIPIQSPYAIVPHSQMWRPGASLLNFGPGVKGEEKLGLNADCPVASEISTKTGLVMLHHMFLGNSADMDDIAAAFEKVQRNSGELKLDALEKKAKTAVKSVLKTFGFGS